MLDRDSLDRRWLAALGFTPEESAELLWLRQWYQSGGSDRARVVKHWYFLKWLVWTGRLDGDMESLELIKCHQHAGMAHLVDDWRWRTCEGDSFRSCPYCGSVHPDDLVEALKHGASLTGSDWKYGFPHKFYVRGGPPNMIKYYTVHLLDMSNEAFDAFAPILSQQSGITFGRNAQGIYYQAPYHGYQR